MPVEACSPSGARLGNEAVGEEEGDRAHRDPDTGHLGSGFPIRRHGQLEGRGRHERARAECRDPADEDPRNGKAQREVGAEEQRRLAEQPPESGLEHRLRLTAGLGPVVARMRSIQPLPTTLRRLYGCFPALPSPRNPLSRSVTPAGETACTLAPGSSRTDRSAGTAEIGRLRDPGPSPNAVKLLLVGARPVSAVQWVEPSSPGRRFSARLPDGRCPA